MLGVASPRGSAVLGHAPIALPVLLSEVYTSVCPIEAVPDVTQESLHHHYDQRARRMGAMARWDSSKEKFVSRRTEAFKLSYADVEGEQKLKVGFVSGTLDSTTGRIMIGLLNDFRNYDHGRLVLYTVGLCFPTPRDPKTDLLSRMFDKNINLKPDDFNATRTRILESQIDVLVFTDVMLDSRVFALAHERMAIYQVLYIHINIYKSTHIYMHESCIRRPMYV
jgi:predicted O-linked N-acetylglucosamine transferase (SPINDLY family)